ncbi:MAG: putative virulence factor [Muribaculaceae bacterium]|nr:putative virulence factor [Muribaculaceae bacterium]
MEQPVVIGLIMEHFPLIKKQGGIMITKKNVNKLQEAIDQVSQMIDWTNENTQSGKKLSLVKELVKARRCMKRIYNAMIDNPSIAAYGESQQGKSYIISSLLGTKEGLLMVPDDDGNMIDFRNNCNNITDEQESTGVVTRFTSTDFIQNPRFPVMLKLFSISDFVTLLSDSFMKDITGYVPYNENDLKGISGRIAEQYSDRPIIKENPLTEDDIEDIEDYLSKHNPVTTAVYVSSGYFDTLCTIIRNVPLNEWVNVFSPLWKCNETYNALFSLYVAALKNMDFNDKVYISIKPVLNDNNDGASTLMCVDVLNLVRDSIEIMKGSSDSQTSLLTGITTKVLLPSGREVNLNKGLLSAMTAEAVYHIDSSVLEDDVVFNLDHIRASQSRTAEENMAMMRNAGFGQSFKKSFLKSVDLLDFPGARGRDLGYRPSEILKQIVKLLLRSKVSYLFNKYSEEYRLSILMFCHTYKNTTPNLVAPILNEWVNTYIGSDAKSREENLIEYDVPPLFLVSTFYNMDLVIKNTIDTKIWERRFGTIWYSEVIDHESNKWFDEWLPNKKFDNTFLLRDYFFSSDSHDKGNRLFHGYPGPETEELKVQERAELKEIFLRDKHINIFFSNPELAWNVASTVGNDGSYYMLKRLASASEKASSAREKKFNKELAQLTDSVNAIIKSEYHDETEAQLLEKNIRTGKRFKFSLLGCYEESPEFFGQLIQFLQVNSGYLASFFSNIIHSRKIQDQTKIQKYESLIRAVEEAGYNFNSDDTEEGFKENMEILKSVFGINGPNDPLLKGCDLKILFSSTYKRNCSPSMVLAEAFVNHWGDYLMKQENSIAFTRAGFDTVLFSDFVENIVKMMKKVELTKHISNSIKEYVDYAPAIAPQNEAMIADIASSVYNDFVMDMGYSLLSYEDKERVEKNIELYKLPSIITDEMFYQPINSDEEQLNYLFSQLEMLNEGEGGQLTKLPSYVNMRRWLAFVIMSFALAYEAGNYNVEANRLLGKLLARFDTSRNAIKASI